MTQHSEFDLAVIGTGGAAMSAAIHARLEGASVVAIERGTLGGTCVNVGCVPSKTLLAAAHTRHAALANPFPGAPTSAGTVDLGALVRQKDDLVGMLRQTKYADIAAAYGFDILPGAATFTDPATLLIDERPVRARSYLVAIGAEPHVPAIPGLEHVDYLTSTTAMELTELPASLVVIGGGFVGLEQAQLFARLGVAVTIIGRLAPHAEPELSSELRKAFLSEGITVVGDRAAAIIQDDGVVGGGAPPAAAPPPPRSPRPRGGWGAPPAPARRSPENASSSPPDAHHAPTGSTSPRRASRPTTAASSSSTSSSGPRTRSCSPPATSPTCPSTCTSPRWPGRSQPATPSATTNRSTTPGCPPSCSPRRSSAPPASPKPKPSPPDTGAPADT